MLVQRVKCSATMPFLTNHKIALQLICAVALLIITGCSKFHHPLHPNYEDLQERGFYVYVLPKDVVEQQGWLQRVTIWSWDRHCKSTSVGEAFNPIEVTYLAKSEQIEFSLKVDPWNVAWDSSRPVTETTLSTPWAMDSIAVYYVSGDYVVLKFNDRFGIPIQVRSRLPVTEVVELVDRIEYIGPSPSTVINPWDINKCGNY